MPGAGLEPAHSVRIEDFKSPASTNFAIPAALRSFYLEASFCDAPFKLNQRQSQAKITYRLN